MVDVDKRLQNRRFGLVMNSRDIAALIDYHYWATYRVIDAVESLTSEQFTQSIVSSFGSVRDTLVHLYGAEWIWLCRWNGVSPANSLAPDIFPDVATARRMFQEHEVKVREFWKSQSESDLARIVNYKTLAGQAFSSPLWQMQQHVVNHGTYHRGQLTTMLRQLGAAPPKATDLILFYRENPV